MSNTPWTPGPWYIQDADFPIIRTAHEDYGNQAIADTCESTLLFRAPGETLNDSVANARLIAAAPEMAELLQAFDAKTILPDGSVIGLDRHDFERCRALLARIKGETP